MFAHSSFSVWLVHRACQVGVLTVGMAASDLGTIQTINPIGSSLVLLQLWLISERRLPLECSWLPFLCALRSSWAAAMRMFGYAKREIVGRNISMVVPEPMSGAHDSYLRNYVSTGTEVCAYVACARVCVRVRVYICTLASVLPQRILNSTRTLFGRHRMGYIFPMLLNVTRLDTEFAGVMQRIQTQDEYILFLAQSFTVTAATQQSLALLGVRLALVIVDLAVLAIDNTCVTAPGRCAGHRRQRCEPVDVC